MSGKEGSVRNLGSREPPLTITAKNTRGVDWGDTHRAQIGDAEFETSVRHTGGDARRQSSVVT